MNRQPEVLLDETQLLIYCHYFLSALAQIRLRKSDILTSRWQHELYYHFDYDELHMFQRSWLFDMFKRKVALHISKYKEKFTSTWFVRLFEKIDVYWLMATEEDDPHRVPSFYKTIVSLLKDVDHVLETELGVNARNLPRDFIVFQPQYSMISYDVNVN